VDGGQEPGNAQQEGHGHASRRHVEVPLPARRSGDPRCRTLFAGFAE
jgi:hypothetical protein